MRQKGMGLLLLLMLLFPLGYAAAQEPAGENEAEPASEAEAEAAAAEQPDGTYIIRNVTYRIDGRTRKEVLAHTLEIELQRRFSTQSGLREYIADKEQVLTNQRTLESGEILVSYEHSEADTDITYVDLKVKAKDTWNLVLLPYGKYDSNEGLQISLKGRDFNFLGGMETLELNLDYLLRDLASGTERSGTDFTLNSSFEVPFYSYGLDWHVAFSGDITYNTPSSLEVTTSGLPLQANTEVALGVDVPLDFQTWKAELIQEYHLNEEGLDDPDTYYFRSTARFGNELPTGLKLPLCGELSYTPFLFAGFSYKPGGSLSTERRGYETGLDHSLKAGRVDWIGNLRSGTQVSLSNTFKWNYTRSRWISSLSGEYELHHEWGWGGLSSRAGFFHERGDFQETAGKKIRGILDDRIHGDLGLYTNVALPTKMWIWFFDRWFEAHISPFFDYAVVRPEENGSFDFSNAWYGAGVETFAYAKFARSLYLRFSFGVDAEALVKNGNISERAPRDEGLPYEIFIGLGHHY